MANFSVNEVRQFYVVTGVDTTNSSLGFDTSGNSVTVSDGHLRLRQNAAGDSWFEYKSPNGGVAGVGGVVRTDIIEKGKMTYAKVTTPEETPFPRKEISLDASLNSGAPIVGQKYIFRVRFYGMGVGNNDIQYSKSSGVYTARPNDTAEIVFKALVDMFIKGYQKEPEQWVIVKVEGTGNNARIVVEAANSNSAANTPGPQSESLRPYVRGRKTGEPMRFELNVTTVSYSNQDFPWGVVADTTFAGTYPTNFVLTGTHTGNPNTYTNARVVSDMEYFYLGERTVQDRTWSYPHNFEMQYISEPTRTKKYNFLDIEFFYSGDAEDVQRSRKQMTFAFEPALTAQFNAVGTGIKDLLGTTVA